MVKAKMSISTTTPTVTGTATTTEGTCAAEASCRQTSGTTCRCVCKCYGFFRYSDWGVDYNDLPQFEKGDITILYRDRIRVFYSRVH